MTIQEYGCVRIRVKDLMEKKGVSRYRMARLTNTQFEVIDRWYKGAVKKLDTDVLARFCYVLECNPKDVLEYKK